MTIYETIIKKENANNNTCNIVSTMKNNIWSSYIGESNILFQTAINKKSLGGIINDDRSISKKME